MKRKKKHTNDDQLNLVRAWLNNPSIVIMIPKHDGTDEYEPAKILRFVAITQPTEHGLYVEGINNNQLTVDVELNELRPS